MLAVCFFITVSGCEKKGAAQYQGYAEGEFVLVAAPAAGRLEKRWVQRGQDVLINAPLFALEQRNEKSAQHEAEAFAGHIEFATDVLDLFKLPQTS